jgi:hypothetical protein
MENSTTVQRLLEKEMCIGKHISSLVVGKYTEYGARIGGETRRLRLTRY